MSFINDSTAARVRFAKEIKATKLDPTELKIYSEFDDDEKHCFVYADDEHRNTVAVQSFPLSAAAWNLKLKKEIEKLFRGSAILAQRGR